MGRFETGSERRRPFRAYNSLILLLAAVLLVAAAQAMADSPRHDRNHSRNDNFDGAGAWRLGGRNHDGGYDIYHLTGRGWERVHGSAHAVADGWVIGTDRRSGGYGIYRWNGRDWQRVHGGAVEIGGSYEHPWIVNNQGERYTWTGVDWRAEWSGGFGRRNERESYRGDRRRNDW